MYFDNCTTLEELKKAYKKAALKHHPDLGGNVETMKAVNTEYSAKFEELKHKHNTAPNSKQTTETPEEFKVIIEKLLHMEGVEVELCGSWLWIAGNTFSHKFELKAAGCRWSRSKKKWYWRHAEKGCHWSRGKSTMKDIREKYGSEVFSCAPQRKLQGA
jgi:curved DNA-binding protein CbpA